MATRRLTPQLLMLAALLALAACMTACGATVVTGTTGTTGASAGTATPIHTVTATATGAPSGSGGGQQTPPVSGPHGTLSVDVLAGPTCPVQQAENPCAPVRITNRPVTISTPAGAVVATVKTDAQGHFALDLAPGAYVIQVAIIQGEPGMRQESPGKVTVVDGQTTSVQIMLDTGIR